MPPFFSSIIFGILELCSWLKGSNFLKTKTARRQQRHEITRDTTISPLNALELTASGDPRYKCTDGQKTQINIAVKKISVPLT